MNIPFKILTVSLIVLFNIPLFNSTNFSNIFGILLLIISIILFILCSVFLVKITNKIISREKNPYLYLTGKIVLIFICVFILSSINLNFIFKNKITDWKTLLLIISIISVIVVTISEASDFFTRWKEYIIRSEKIEKENIIAKYEALKEQIHPHFLFNGLNTLIGLIESNDKKAATYATNLSEFLKYLLTYQNKKLISVKEEMDVVNQYTYIQHVRFKDNLIVNIDIDKKCIDKKIPPLAIQMLVENAIKHNAISKKQKLEISIKNIDLEWIEIKNNKQAKAFANSAQVGLKNINNRYSFVSHKQIEVNDVNNEFSVKLPLL